ncbi:MAG: hypothetical protein LBK61_06170 [Spirochaetaceae bacterium]|jgi:hypothetical protein|nr:hypothetical protein [Spirochaetaceae bacterium]
MKRRLLVIAFLGLACSLFAGGGKEAAPLPPVVEEQYPQVPVYEEVTPLYEEDYTPYVEVDTPAPDVRSDGLRTLGVLPFTGVTTGDGEALALLFSNNAKLRKSCSVVPLTRNVQQQIRTEQQNTAASGNQPPVDFVMVGIVRNIRNNNVILVNIVEQATRQLIAGDFRIYRDPSELQSLIPAMIDHMMTAVERPRGNLSKLAVTAFDTPQPGVSTGEAEILALLLSAEIASSGTYAVFPRMEPLLQALEQMYQMGGAAYNSSASQTGLASAELVLTGSVITLGTRNLFVAQIERIIDSGVIHGAEESYDPSSDGIIQVIPRLAQALTGVPSIRAVPASRTAGQSDSATASAATEQSYVPDGGDYRPTIVIPQGNQTPAGGTGNTGTTTYPPSSGNTGTVPNGGTTTYPPSTGNPANPQQYYNPMAPR